MAAQPANSDIQPWRENLSNYLKCPDCNEWPPNLIHESSSTVCGSCGIVLADRIISMESEWRTFSNDDGGKNNNDPSRVGEAVNTLLDGSQLETTMSYAGGTKLGQMLSRAQNRQLENKSNKALQKAYIDIDHKCDGFAIPANVKNTAKSYYKATQDGNAFKGKPVEVIIAACIFLACRQCGVGRSFNEIFSMTSVPKKDIGRLFKKLESYLSTQDHRVLNVQSTAGTQPTELFGRFCNMLNLPHHVAITSHRLAEKADDVLAGRSPLSIVSACIYFISNLIGRGKSAKEISKVAKVSDGTIRNAYKLLYKRREELVEADWKGDIANLPSA
ncbi:MAG: hypothetical protein Q9227_007587 [Pyrenula ochraceoflavens]